MTGDLYISLGVFMAGLVSFLSPCVLPLVPGYVSYIAGSTAAERDRSVTPGTAKILVSSNLIPKLPFKNMANSVVGAPTGGKESAWNIVTNLGNGESYYYNVKTGVTQVARPDRF